MILDFLNFSDEAQDKIISLLDNDSCHRMVGEQPDEIRFRLSLNENENDNMRHEIVPLMKSMLSRKCNTLSFGKKTRPLNRDVSISLKDAEKLIQFVHQLNMNVSLSTYSDCQPSITQIGFLPYNALINQRRFLSCQSMLRLREVSKFTKDAVETFIIITRLNSLRIHERGNQKDIKLAFWICDRLSCDIWKKFVFAATQKSGAIVNIEDKWPNGFLLWSVLNPEQLDHFLACFKTIVRASEIRTLDIDCVYPEIIPVFSIFLQEKTIGIVNVYTRNQNSADFYPWIDSIKKFGPNMIDFLSVTLTRGAVELILRFADLSKHIRVFLEKKSDLRHDIVKITQSIFERKCEKFTLVDIVNECLLSVSDIERMQKSFHRLVKKVSFSGHTCERSMDIQIGSYTIRVLSKPSKKLVDDYILRAYVSLIRIRDIIERNEMRIEFNMFEE
ncbi:hypothetical protein PRIPAC_74737, partial [Pristionchus pacificus]|uniref:Uncharacterized protein n=1 Tax=Pristionchus pacificus TaxID=54126 RepID=A0A2A6C1T7_PRIPA